MDTINITNRGAAISSLSLWKFLSPDEQRQLQDQILLRSFERGDMVYMEDDDPQYLFCQVSGHTKIYKVGHSGRMQIMRIISPLQYYGYRAYFEGNPYVTSAAAMEHCVVALLPMHVVENIALTNAALAMFFVRELSVDLGIADERSIILTQSHIRGRMAEALLFLYNNFGVEKNGYTLSLRLSREDLASLSNMTTANCIRTLSAFQQEQIIQMEGRQISLLSLAQLTHIARIG